MIGLYRKGWLQFNIDQESYMNQKQYLNALDFFSKAYKIQSSRQEWDCRDTLVMYNSTKETYLEWNPEGNFKQWLEEKMKEPD